MHFGKSSSYTYTDFHTHSGTYTQDYGYTHTKADSGTHYGSHGDTGT